MKLLLCTQCQDVIKLDYEPRSCKCGLCSGKYLEDGWHAEVSARGILIGLSNKALIEALYRRVSEPDESYSLETWLISENSPRVKRLKE